MIIPILLVDKHIFFQSQVSLSGNAVELKVLEGIWRRSLSFSYITLLLNIFYRELLIPPVQSAASSSEALPPKMSFFFRFLLFHRLPRWFYCCFMATSSDFMLSYSLSVTSSSSTSSMHNFSRLINLPAFMLLISSPSCRLITSYEGSTGFNLVRSYESNVIYKLYPSGIIGAYSTSFFSISCISHTSPTSPLIESLLEAALLLCSIMIMRWSLWPYRMASAGFVRNNV